MMELLIDGRSYDVQVTQKVSLPPTAPRLAVVSRQHNETAINLVRVCIDAVRHFTAEPHELWVIDNNSPWPNIRWLSEQPGINIALNRTEPLPEEARNNEKVTDDPDSQLTWDSYANAIGLEIAAKLIDPQSNYLMSMHMDTMPCRAGWLSYLQSKINDKVRAAGVRLDRTRTPEGVLHVLGYMVDFQLFKKLQLDYLPDLPELDVGDKVTVRLRERGYEVFACPNTLWDPALAEKIPASSPLKDFRVDRAFDDDGNVIFLHLGRGVRKSIGVHIRGTLADDWVKIAYEHLLV
ncbi:MAG: hypothetical protein ACLP5H_16320 [Desulfomonilaceae bacterium]